MMSLANPLKHLGRSWPFEVENRPAIFVILFGLLLSLVALASDPVLNRDGMFYVDIARQIQTHGLEAARDRFSWLFLPLLLAGPAILTDSDPAIWAHYFIIFTAVSSGVLIFHILLRYDQKHPWTAALIACCIPFMLRYRADLTRDIGGWLFILLSYYSLLRWHKLPTFRWGLLFQLAAAIGTLFRIEAATLYIVAAAWAPIAKPKQYIQNVLQLSLLPILAVLAVASIDSANIVTSNEKIQGAMSYTKVTDRVSAFQRVLEKIQPSFHEEMTDDIGFVVSSGIVLLILFKLAKLHGLFLIPLLASFKKGSLTRILRADSGLTLILALNFFIVILIFSFSRLFLVNRYLIPLAVTLLPLTYIGALQVLSRIQRPPIKYIIFLTIIGAALGQVISTSAGKTYIREAGLWIAEHIEDPQSVYYQSQRVSYYATAGYDRMKPEPSLDEVLSNQGKQYKTLAIMVYGKEDIATVYRWAEPSSADIIHSTSNREGNGVLVLSRNKPPK